VPSISPYLVVGTDNVVEAATNPISPLPSMSFGNMPNDGGALLLTSDEASEASMSGVADRFIRPFLGSQEFIQGLSRYCIWVRSAEAKEAAENDWLAERFAMVEDTRLQSARATTKELAETPYRFGEVRQDGDERIIAIAGISSENRDYLPCGLLPAGSIVSNKLYALYNAPLWNLSLVASRMHWVWIGTVCVRLEMRFSYSNTLGWNTFPVPKLTETDKANLTRCAEDILLAREAHFPATIADLYDPEKMPADLRAAHDRNDETLERIYIGRRFRNDTERLEKLFDMYTRMTAKKEKAS
jgi:hypothetical protein